MSTLLDRCAGGSILEKPKPVEVEVNPDQADDLRRRLLEGCLPAQRDFVTDESHRILGYIGGFGSGKSYALTRKLIWLGLLNPRQTLMACEPSFPMIRTVFIPAMDEALESLEIPFTFRASPQPEYVLDLPTGPVKILCQSAENYQRIRGQNIAAACWDEADTSPTETAQKAGEMLLARMRTGNCNQLAIASTPEGFRYCYRTFVEQDGPDKQLIKVKTKDNPNLPPEFIPSLERNYPPQLIAAYLNGEFVNLANCALYPDFDRSLHYTSAKPEQSETIYVGIDIDVTYPDIHRHCQGHSVTQYSDHTTYRTHPPAQSSSRCCRCSKRQGLPICRTSPERRCALWRACSGYAFGALCRALICGSAGSCSYRTQRAELLRIATLFHFNAKD